MTEKTLTTENIKPAIDALRGELAPWPVVAMKQDRLNDTQKSAVNSGITSGLVAQIIANTAAIRALESAITGTGLRPLVVASLPAIGTQGILYIVPVTTYDPATDADVVNYSNEYIWIVAPDAPVTEGYYEQVGQTGIVINNGQLNIAVNGTSVGTFTANQAGDTTAAITVPTNADYVDRTTAQTAAGVKTFSDGIVGNVTGNVTGDLTGTAAKAIADEDGTSIKSGYVNVAGNQTVSGQKTWSGNQFFPSPVYHKNTTYEIGNIPASNIVTNIYLADKNNVYTSFVRSVIYASGRTATEIRAKNAFKNGVLDPTGADISSNLNVEVQPNGAKTIYWDGLIRNDVAPFTTNNNSLGTSTNKWKSLNGINPGVLSLPSSDYVEIDTTNWDKTGATSQSYTPAVPGWLFVSIQNIAGNYLSIVGGRGAVSMDGTGAQAGLRAMLPAVANESVSITVKTGSIFAARFYPMLGNV